MAQMYLVVTIRKSVADRDQGEIIYNIVKQKLAEYDGLAISGHITNHFDVEPEPE